MNTYVYDYDPLPVVADADAQRLLDGSTGARVAAGTPMDFDAPSPAVDERRRREAARLRGNVVTQDELLAASVREIMLLLEHGSVAYQGARGVGAPLYLTRVVRVLTHQLDEMRHKFTHLADRVEGLRLDMEAVERRVNGELDEEMAETEHIRLEVTIIAAQLHNQGLDVARHYPSWIAGAHLHPYVRTNEQNGAGILLGQPALPVPDVQVGEPIANFPDTLEDITAMDNQQIHELAVILDTDFGIEQDDPIEVRRQKVRRYLLHRI